MKVVSRKVGGGTYYKQKGIVERVDGFTAQVCMLESGDVLKVILCSVLLPL